MINYSIGKDYDEERIFNCVTRLKSQNNLMKDSWKGKEEEDKAQSAAGVEPDTPCS